VDGLRDGRLRDGLLLVLRARLHIARRGAFLLPEMDASADEADEPMLGIVGTRGQTATLVPLVLHDDLT